MKELILGFMLGFFKYRVLILFIEGRHFPIRESLAFDN
jgi:hypothetical protein